MPEDPNRLNPEQLWQGQTEEQADMTLQFILYKAIEFQNRVHRRNQRQAIGAVFVTLFIGWIIVYFPETLLRIGAVLLLASTHYSMWDARKRGSSREVPLEGSASACIEFHRRELIRQRDLYRRAMAVHMPLQFPGIAFVVAAAIIQSGRDSLWSSIALVVFVCMVFCTASYRNWRKARKLDQELATLTD